MLFDAFVGQYIEDLISCGDKKYDLSGEDKKEIIDNLRYNESLWIHLDNTIFYYLEDYEREDI